MAKLEVISSTLVPMASADTMPMSRLDLTPWDLQMLLLEPIQKGILFHKPEKQIDLIHRLKNSLSCALDHFPPLAGRLATENSSENNDTAVYFVDCNNKGAGFTHAVAAGVSVADILESKYTPEIVYSFFPLNGSRNFGGTSDPLFSVQVTDLEDGLFVGCTANHAVVDGTSFWHLICSWSEISRGLSEISKLPSFDRVFPNVPVPMFDGGTVAEIVRPPLLERVFHLSKEKLAGLKARANSEAAGGGGQISSFQALVAHLWRCVARCRRIRSQTTADELLALAIGARGRIPLPQGYFGNAVSVCFLALSEAELLGDGLGQIGLKLNALVAQQGTAEAVLGFVEEWARGPALIVMGSSNFLISSSPRFDVYGNDFGWGKPVGVRSGKAQKRDGKVTIFGAADDGGVEVEVCLAPETLMALEKDGEFMETIDEKLEINGS